MVPVNNFWGVVNVKTIVVSSAHIFVIIDEVEEVTGEENE